MKRKIGAISFEVEQGDIAAQGDVEAVVNAANAQLTTGGGVAGALHSAAGPELYRECRPLAPISPGQAVITSAGNLPNNYVIHCLGPVYGRDTPSDKFLRKCYINSLMLAKENHIKSIAFPAISTGAFGYPFEEALEVTFKSILGVAGELKQLQRIKFVLHSSQDFERYKEKLQALDPKKF